MKEESGRNRFFAVKITRWTMSIFGLWVATTEKEERLFSMLRKILLIEMGFSLWTLIYEIYTCDPDFYSVVQAISNGLPTILAAIKMGALAANRKKYVEMLKYMDKHFWNVNFDKFGEDAMQRADKMLLMLTITLNLNVHVSNVFSMSYTIVDNLHINKSERRLPYDTTVGLPKTESPYFEITFTLEAILFLYIMLCCCGYDSLFVMLTLYTSAQFEILGHQLGQIFTELPEDQQLNVAKEQRIAKKLENCIMRHYVLLSHVDRLNDLFRYVNLFQVVFSSILICIASFEFVVDQSSYLRSIMYFCYALAGITELWMYTTTIQHLTTSSIDVGDAIYRSDWPNAFGKIEKKTVHAMLMIMMRSVEPATMKAGYLIIGQETFTSVMSTAFSYLTLIRTVEPNSNAE